jgi:hypothetical protein
MRGPDLAYMSRMVPDMVRLLLVPTWYEQPSVADAGNMGMMFDAM